MIEAQTIDSLPAMRREAETPLAVRLSATQLGDAVLGTIRHDHVWDGSTGGIKDNAFDLLSKLGLFDNYAMSNRIY